jgi:hypothetical protein
MLCERLRAAEPSALGEVHDLVLRTAVAMARMRKVVPAHGGAWTLEDVEDLVSEFFADLTRIGDLAVKAVDDRALKASIETSLMRVSIDLFRATPLGVLMRRIDRRMKERPDVISVPPNHWALVAHAGNPHWAEGEDALVAAAASVSISDPPPQSPEGTRRTPVTDTASLDAVCMAVLGRAGAPVERKECRRVIAHRILPQQRAESLSSVEHGQLDRYVPDPSKGSGSGAVLARAIWDNLNNDEKTLLPDLIASSRALEAEGVLGLRKSALDARQQKLSRKLRELLEGFDEQEDAARCLLDLAASSAGQDPRIEP